MCPPLKKEREKRGFFCKVLKKRKNIHTEKTIRVVARKSGDLSVVCIAERERENNPQE